MTRQTRFSDVTDPSASLTVSLSDVRTLKMEIRSQSGLGTCWLDSEDVDDLCRLLYQFRDDVRMAR